MVTKVTVRMMMIFGINQRLLIIKPVDHTPTQQSDAGLKVSFQDTFHPEATMSTSCRLQR